MKTNAAKAKRGSPKYNVIYVITERLNLNLNYLPTVVYIFK